MLILEDWKESDYINLMDELRAMGSNRFDAFTKKLIPDLKESFGIPIPALRLKAKEIFKGNWQSFLQLSFGNVHEELLIRAIVIARAPTSIEEKFRLVSSFIPHINNWAVCDVFCGELKQFKNHLDLVQSFLKQYLESDKEYYIRFAAVLMISYFINEDYIDHVLASYDAISHDAYYVKMAVAWGISIAYIKFPSKTMPFLLKNSLDDFTFNKALQKIIESRRVTDEDKEIIRSMKRK